MVTHVYTWAKYNNLILKIHTIYNAVDLNKVLEPFFSNVKKINIESSESSQE